MYDDNTIIKLYLAFTPLLSLNPIRKFRSKLTNGYANDVGEKSRQLTNFELQLSTAEPSC